MCSRENGRLPIYVGVPGIADPRRLLRMAVKIGVGDSARFLRGRKSGLLRMVLPGGYSTEWFVATKLGEYHIFCSEYCGAQHSKMIGRVIVMEPADYQAWLAGGSRC